MLLHSCGVKTGGRAAQVVWSTRPAAHPCFCPPRQTRKVFLRGAEQYAQSMKPTCHVQGYGVFSILSSTYHGPALFRHWVQHYLDLGIQPQHLLVLGMFAVLPANVTTFTSTLTAVNLDNELPQSSGNFAGVQALLTERQLDYRLFAALCSP